VIGIARALQLSQAERTDFALRTDALRRRLLEGLTAAYPGLRVNGHPTQRLPHNLHLCFEGVEGESLVEALSAVGIECSAGAACTSATWEPSHVLLAMGVPIDLAIGSLRLTLWPSLTEEQIDRVAAALPHAVEELRREAVSAD
jgi:cysteine desulfurase